MKTKLDGSRMTPMRHLKGVVLVVLAGVLSACGGGTDAASRSVPAPAPVATGPAQVASGTWVVMGSSTAAGAGASQGKGWASLLEAAYSAHGVRIANIANGGTVTYEGLGTNTTPVAGRPAPDPALNIDQALSRKPVLLIVSYPTNDTALGYSVDETVRNLLAIRAQALAAKVPVVLTSTQPRNLTDAQLAQMRTIDERVAASVGECFVDVRQVLAGINGLLAPNYDSGDGVHPNEAGHQVITAQVEKMIAARKCVSVAS
jgi:lysophospholipase L1-like esterase